MSVMLTDVLGGLVESLDLPLEPGASTPTVPAVPARPAVPVEDEPRWSGTDIDTIASPEVRRPSVAARTAVFPLRVFNQRNLPARADVDLMGEPFLVRAAGVLKVTAFVVANAATTVLSLSLDDGRIFAALNNGSALTVGAWFSENLDVDDGDRLQIRSSATTTLGVLRLLFREGS